MPLAPVHVIHKKLTQGSEDTLQPVPYTHLLSNSVNRRAYFSCSKFVVSHPFVLDITLIVFCTKTGGYIIEPPSSTLLKSHCPSRFYLQPTLHLTLCPCLPIEEVLYILVYTHCRRVPVLGGSRYNKSRARVPAGTGSTDKIFQRSKF